MQHPNITLVRDYATALRHFEAVTPWRTRPDDPRPAIQRSARYTVGQLADESVCFYNNNSPAITYHPDDTVSVHGESDWSNGRMSSVVSPEGVHVLPRRGIVMLTQQGTGSPWGEWRYRRSGRAHRYARVPNTTTRVIRKGQEGEPVRLRLDGFDWVIENEGDLKPFQWFAPNRKRAGELSRQWRLTDFLSWFDMTTRLSPENLPEHDAENVGEALTLIRDGRFLDACKWLPTKYASYWRKQSLPLREVVNLRELRVQLYKNHRHVLDHKVERVLTYGQYHTQRSYLYLFGRP